MTLDAVVVGGGQAGLASGYWLARRGLDFEILDAAPEVGASWRQRWDSLTLFTPARYSELPGMAFPRPQGADRFWCPDKDRMADYLASYVERFSLPIRLGSRVVRLRREDSTYVVETGGDEQLRAKTVVAATGAHQVQRVPDFAAELDPGLEQVESASYRRPSQIEAERVLIVGAGASGAEIAIELAAAGRQVVLAGPKLIRLPRRILGVDLYWWLHASRVIRARCDRIPGSWICGRSGGGDEVVGLGERDFERSGIRRVGRITGARDGAPAVEGGERLEVEAIVWCSGYGYEFDSWIELPVLDGDGMPIHDRGIVRGEPGLGVVGLPYQSRPDSALVGGVGAEAEQVVERLGPGCTEAARA